MQIRALTQGALCLFGLAQAAAAISTLSGSNDALLPSALKMRERPEGAPAAFGADQLNASAPYLTTLADLDALEADYGGRTRIEVVAGSAAVINVGEHGDEPAWHVGTVSPQAVTEMLASCEADTEGQRNADEAAGGVVSFAAQTRCSKVWCLENTDCWIKDCTYCLVFCVSRLAERMGTVSAKYLVSETGVITIPDAEAEQSPSLQTPEEMGFYKLTRTSPTGIYFQISVKRIARELDDWENLRTIDVVLSSTYDGLGEIEWESTTAEELFGGHTIVMIDLRDEVEFSGANKLLRQERSDIGRSHLANLIEARRVLDDSNQTVSTSWTQILSLARYSWLKGAYKREKEQVTDAVKVKRDHTKWDLNHPWIKRTLVGMPEVRPFFMLARRDHTFRPAANSRDPDTSYSEESE
ncbi:hypothetical protein DL764_006757 [Monosporascus ibericus]|uniref:Uncharacterized protein n=1 Tax=Monosporascus ibericus TaxID=155417 RepID=A0A4Q4T7I0_9PEZI|nr:hypothetical protein DL764_006757 [Monosporascus ibericus]